MVVRGWLIMMCSLAYTAGFTNNFSRLRLESGRKVMGRQAALNFDLPDEEVLNAIERANGQATVADVAEAAGVPLSKARADLVILSSILAGEPSTSLMVDEEGEILYTFPKKVRGALRRKSRLAKVTGLWRRVKPGVATVGRYAFGASLLVNVLMIAGLISAAGNSNSDSNSNTRSQSSSSMLAFNIIDIVNFSDRMRFYRALGTGEKMEMDLLQSVYSYVFGDGDPNYEIPQEQLQKTAAMIRAKGGAVTAEQLAPFLDPTDSGSDSSSLREQWVLPALLDLGGSPEVTEDGDIIYVFPDLVSTAGIQGRTDGAGSYLTTASQKAASLPSPVTETELKFSLAPKSTLVAVAALGILDAAGVVALGRSGFLSAGPGARRIYAALATYAVAFNGAPVIRWVNMRRENKAIAARNDARLNAARLLQEADRNSDFRSGDEHVNAATRKINSARNYGFKRLRTIGEDTSIVYDTSKSQGENAVDNESTSLKSFDSRLDAVEKETPDMAIQTPVSPEWPVPQSVRGEEGGKEGQTRDMEEGPFFVSDMGGFESAGTEERRDGTTGPK